VNTQRKLRRRVTAQPASDGDGVKIQRIAGRAVNADFDPFLLLDEIRSADGADYIGGFPPHPHRGFETVTYMLAGSLRHEDHLGNRGLLADGGVQWMTAGRGIVHSEMPQQTDGLLHGFQLWLNLPAADKMQPAAYVDYPSASLPRATVPGGELVVIAGRWGDLQSPVPERHTRPTILDIALQPGAALTIPVAPPEQAAFYVYDGASSELGLRELGFYADGDSVRIEAQASGLRGLFLAGLPLREPISQYGPFVMNTREEIEQAVSDYNSGQLMAG